MEEEKEDKVYRNTISFGISNANKLKNEKPDNRARSASLSNNKLLSKYIPRLKPIGTNINPSPINLKGKEEIIIEEENFKIEHKRKLSKKSLYKIKSFEINEEANDYVVNSTDEEHNYNKYNKNKLPQNISDSSDNESIKNKNNKLNKNKDNPDNNPDNDPDINDDNVNKIEKFKKNLNGYINKIRRKLDKIKNNIKMKKCKDDSNALNFSYTKYFSENNEKIKCGENYINKLKVEKIEKIDYNEIKNKTISFKDFNSFKPPILGFLQMKEISNN